MFYRYLDFDYMYQKANRHYYDHVVILIVSDLLKIAKINSLYEKTMKSISKIRNRRTQKNADQP